MKRFPSRNQAEANLLLLLELILYHLTRLAHGLVSHHPLLQLSLLLLLLHLLLLLDRHPLLLNLPCIGPSGLLTHRHPRIVDCHHVPGWCRPADADRHVARHTRRCHGRDRIGDGHIWRGRLPSIHAERDRGPGLDLLLRHLDRLRGPNSDRID